VITGGADPTTVVAARQRRRRQAQVALSAVAVLAVTGAALLVARIAGGPDGSAAEGHAPGSRPPAELMINGRTVHREGPTPVRSVQATSRGASTLLVLAGTVNPDAPSPCYPWTDLRIVGQDDRTVSLAATTYVDRTGGSSVVCTSIGRPGGRFSLTLAAPLGDRRIVQDDRVVPVLFTDALLHATVVPDGYAREPTVIEEDPGQPGLIRTMHAGPDQATSLEIDQGPVDQPPTDPDRSEMVEVLDRLTVRGHPAVFRQTPKFDDNRCLVWAETATTGVAVCSLGTHAPLTAAQLATVAEGLVRTP
jgi:hypothetical protein